MAGGSDRRATSRRNIPWLGGGRRNTVPDGSVFISYRRGDSAGHTGRLYDGLSAALGDAAVFMDIDAIDPGVDFAQRIRQALTICRVALVVIGPRWISAAAPDGARRLDDPEDYLRMEIAAALRRDDVVVVPVLVDRSEPHRSGARRRLGRGSARPDGERAGPIARPDGHAHIDGDLAALRHRPHRLCQRS